MTGAGLDPVALLEALIAIDSVNPDLVPGAPGEGTIADFCAGWLADRGFAVHRLERVAGRPSIVAVARGTGGGRSILLDGHTDTVSVAGYQGDPFLPVRRDGKVFGRGAYDMKSGLAAIMVAAARATRTPLSGDVVVACVADEEFGSLGTEEVVARFPTDAALVAEPTGLELTVAHRGFAWFDLTLTGRAAHGSMPHLGVDAIEHAGRVLTAVGDLRRALGQAPAHPVLGHGAARVALIAGGEDAATVAPVCRLTIERRMLPGESPDAAEASLREILEHLATTVPEFRYQLERRVGRAGFEASPDWPIVTAVSNQAARVLGAPPPRRGEPFWTDAGLFAEAGIPVVLFGVKGGGAHAAIEWVDESSLHQLTDILTGTIVEFTGLPLAS